MICVSACAETADELFKQIERAEDVADVVEVRFDCLAPTELTNASVSPTGGKPLLATFRAPEQGGRGSAANDERREFWRKLPEGFWGADLEADVVEHFPDVPNRIASFHDFDGVPADLDGIYDALAAAADIVKIAVRADDITDAIPIWSLLERARSDGKRLIPIAMGDAGRFTRVLGLAHGAFLTYASLGTGTETADGQIDARDMADVYRVKALDADTRVFGVLGDPIAQSMSPYMHNPAFVSAGVNAVFISLLVKDLMAFFDRMVRPASREVDLNFGGFSVTMPHKQSIMPLLDTIDTTAEKIGAVNTVKIDGGTTTGYNTDVHGFITPLKARFGDLRDANVAVFGTGGAARACVYALKQENANVTVHSRDAAKAEAFAAEFDICGAIGSKHGLSGLEIVVDSTPTGMKGPLEHVSLFTAEELAGVKFVYDLVTRSDDTPLIREAKRAGVPAIGGLEMLIAQGAKQFEIWTGQNAPADLMKDALMARMKR